MASNEANGKTNGEVQKVNESSLLPHLETIDRLLSLPSVSMAWSQSQGVYGKVKGKSATFVLKFWVIRNYLNSLNTPQKLHNVFEVDSLILLKKNIFSTFDRKFSSPKKYARDFEHFQVLLKLFLIFIIMSSHAFPKTLLIRMSRF